MKKLFLSLVAVMALTVAVQAQDDIKAGSVSLEVQFLPANNVPIQLDYLRARYFLSENMAVRVGFLLNRYAESDENTNTATPPVTEIESYSHLTFGFFPGIEMHFPVGERLSPYVGAEIGFMSKSSSSEIQNVNNVSGVNISSSGIWVDGTNQAYSSFGLNLVTGMDFYIYQGLYMGVELGLGFESFGFKDFSITSGATTVTTTSNAKQSSLGLNTVNAIRLGWKF